MDTAPSAPLRVRIYAPNAPNPIGRWRGKPARLWTKEPVEIEVVDNPKGANQISHASFARIKDDDHIKVEFSGAVDIAAAGVSALHAKIAEQAEQIERLGRDLHDEAERMTEERRLESVAAKDLATRLERAEGEIANLRGKLADAQAPKPKK